MKPAYCLLGVCLAGLLANAAPAYAREWHVSPRGNDTADGSADRMLRSISEAAKRAMPGDVVTVHEGVYRERVNPPRGGTGDDQRIIYQASPGGRVVIKGSEQVRGWEKAGNDTWKAVLPAAMFGEFNPFADLISGDWFKPLGRSHHTGAVYLNGHWLTEAADKAAVMEPAGETPLWFAEVSGESTTVWAQFKGIDPNKELVEANVRRAVFYPSQPGINYITVKGFIMRHAATPWAPPTAEQIGLLGTHWSRGWVIEDNTISHSVCTGITLGKHGDEHDNTSANSAVGYVETVKRAHAFRIPWDGEHVGHHIVRRNRISHCEQAGLVGSLGAVFSTISDNDISDIHVRRLFGGAEQAAIKIHAAIDCEISGNRIQRTNRGIWLDWMAQGTRVSRNLLHDNDEDLFVEVNHGPFMIDHNLFLSDRISLRDVSQGGAYVHNLFAGRFDMDPEPRRETPYHPAHSTEVAGLRNIEGGDDRFINNLFIGPAGLDGYDDAKLPVMMAGNVFVKGAKASKDESGALVDPDFDPALKLTEDADGSVLEMALAPSWRRDRQRGLVTTDLLGKAVVSGLPFLKPDGTACRMARDYRFAGRPENPFPGPFEPAGEIRLKSGVWPVVR